ncbi:MerR family transcriptional regulator [[Actinomadura] parvosata]
MYATMRLNVDMKSNPVMAIGDVAARFGLAPHVLRHWEAMGLLAPARAEGDRRRYGRDDLYRIAVILRAREAGIGLEDLRQMLTTTDPAARRELLHRHREDLVRRIAAAQAQLDLLDCALTCDHEDFSSCRHFQAMLTERVEQAAAPSAVPVGQ